MNHAGRRYYFKTHRVPEKAMKLINLPIADLTLEQIAAAVNVRPATAGEYLKILRREGLITDFFKRKRASSESCAARRQRNIAANQAAIARVTAELADTREALCPATWAVYAAVLSPEDMAKNFKRKRG